MFFLPIGMKPAAPRAAVPRPNFNREEELLVVLAGPPDQIGAWPSLDSSSAYL